MPDNGSGQSIVYVGSAGTSDIHVFRLDAEGHLTPLSVAPLPGVITPASSTPLAVSPDRRFLYAALRSEPFSVVSFRIDPRDGGLEPIGAAPLADTMAYLATDRSGRQLLSASYHGGRIAVNPIGPDGLVGPPSQVVQTEPKAHAILADPGNAWVFATSLGGDVLHRYHFDAATGALSGGDIAARVAAGSGPRHFAFHPNGRFLFLLNELSGTLDVFSIETGDAPFRHLQTVAALPEDFSGKPWAADVHVTPDGLLLYASERTSSRLFGFRVDPESGRLTPCGDTATETQPRGFAIDPTGRFLVAAGEVSHGVASYAIDRATGGLAAAARVEAGRGPNWIEIVDLP